MTQRKISRPSLPTLINVENLMRLEGLLDELEGECNVAQLIRDGQGHGKLSDAVRKVLESRSKILDLFSELQQPEPWVKIEPGCAMPDRRRNIDIASHANGELHVQQNMPFGEGYCWNFSDTHWRYHTPVRHPDEDAVQRCQIS